MVNLNIITLGKYNAAWIDSACKDYSLRFANSAKINLINFNSNKDFKKDSKLFNITSVYHIALDIPGVMLSTEQLASKLGICRQNYKTINFFIGGADGLSKEILANASFIWSLSKLTFPHGLVKLLILEQLYRAFSILSNHPYHRF